MQALWEVYTTNFGLIHLVIAVVLLFIPAAIAISDQITKTIPAIANLGEKLGYHPVRFQWFVIRWYFIILAFGPFGLILLGLKFLTEELREPMPRKKLKNDF